MTPDLFSTLEDGPTWSNYATRLVHLWITGDPSLEEQCRESAERYATKRSRAGHDDCATLADELRALVTAEAVQTERYGLFADLFADRPPEIQWSELAAFYLEMAAESS